MTVLKCITGVCDPIMKANGFKRKGFIYYRMQNDILQGVSVQKQYHDELIVEATCFPYWLPVYHTFFKSNAWIHNNAISRIVTRCLSMDDDQSVMNETVHNFNIFCEKILPVLDQIKDIESYISLMSDNIYDLGLIPPYNFPKVFIISEYRGRMYNGLVGRKPPSPTPGPELDVALYKAYLDGRNWEDFKDEIIQRLDSTKSFYIEYKEQEKLPDTFEECFDDKCISEHPGLLFPKFLHRITLEKNLNAIKDYVDERKDESKQTLKQYLKLDITDV